MSPMEETNRDDELLPVLVSACLLGRACRYDGGHNRDQVLEEHLRAEGQRPVAFCPEEAGGLSTPRPPAWIEEGGASAVLEGRSRLVTESGTDVTAEFVRGAEGALLVAQQEGAQQAYLKERSPSCGVEQTHVDGRLTQGPGVTAALLQRSGIQCVGVEGRRLTSPPDPIS